MADKKDKDCPKKKAGSKWRKRVNIAGLGSKDKGQGFAQVRRVKALREYKKLLKKTRQEQQISSYVQNVYRTELNSKETEEKQLPSEENETPKLHKEAKTQKEMKTTSHQTTKTDSSKKTKDITSSPRNKRKWNDKKSAFAEAENQYKKKKFDIKQNEKEREAQKEKRSKELQESMERRRQTHHQLNKRTRRGQPVMANQINHLLFKINSTSS